jgi:hypothetical protein
MKAIEKSVLQQLRDIRDKLSLEIQDMSYEQLKEYLDKQKSLHPKSKWHKQEEIAL